MKYLYLLILLFTVSVGHGQDATTNDGIDGFKLYPNPVTNGKIFISTAKNAPKKVLIYDVLGTEVLQTTLLGKELNLSDLDSGVYMLRVFQNNKVATRKLIIK
jgi:hypothetical protein